MSHGSSWGSGDQRLNEKDFSTEFVLTAEDVEVGKRGRRPHRNNV